MPRSRRRKKSDGRDRKPKRPGADPVVARARALSRAGHPGEGAGLLEQYLREHPGSEPAGHAYGSLLRNAFEMDEPGESERDAIARFRDRSGLEEVKRAVAEFLDRTRWGALVTDRAATGLEEVPQRILSVAETRECAALAFEAAVWGAQEEAGRMPLNKLIALYRDGLVPDTPLTAFASDSGTPPHLARRASDWAEHSHYGLWQLIYPEPRPGAWARDLISGTQRFLDFPPEVIGGAPRWSVWLGGAIVVDGVWRVTGTGLMLSPAEADAVAAVVDHGVDMMAKTLSGMPLAEMVPGGPIPFGKAPPWGVRWEYFNPLGPEYAKRAGGVLMMLSAKIAGQVYQHRISHGRAEAPVPAGPSWVREPLAALDGRTPLQAAGAGAPWQMVLESRLRQFEYQGADTAGLRTALGWGEGEGEGEDGGT
ncbi:MAG: hypothetical protein FWE35_03330 [Streptosporangiales bacterium]|nr:hypothetical protein [Streptosporangiales bacterium]